MGFGFTAFFGKDVELELGEEQNDAKQEFKMWALGGECAIIGSEAGFGVSGPGKTWDGNDLAVILYAGGGIDPASATAEVIITLPTRKAVNDGF